MQLRFTALKWATLATFAVSGIARAQEQTPPATQTSPSTPGDTAQSVPEGAAPEAAGPSERKQAQEEIVVTGSRVRRKDLTTPAPVTVINRQQIQTSGVANIGDFLQQLPEQGNAANTQVNNGGDGETQISLRSLGAGRTLVLIDGKRMVAGGGGAGSTFTGGVVDLNTIPTAAIERVEILKDGASAIYGSDAIGGVVNIITRRRMNGIEASAYAGTSQHADGTVYDLSILGGASNDKGSFILGAGYYDQKLMYAGARDWAVNALAYDYTVGAIGKGGSSAVPQGRVNGLDPTTCTTALCTSLTGAFGPTRRNWIYDPAAPACSGLQSNPLSGCQADGWRPFNNAKDLYNYQAVNYLITPSTRYSFFGNGEFHVSDYARVYSQASFVNRQSSILLAPEPLFTINSGLTVSATNAFNPFGKDLTDVRRRLVELSGRSNGFDLDTIRLVAGMDGTMPESFGPFHGWYWDASFNFGRGSGLTTYFGSLNTQLTQNGLGPSSGGQCIGAGGAPIPACTPVDLFHGAGTITPEMATTLGLYKGINQGWNQQAVTEVNLSGELFTVAADRPAGLALGFQHRNEWGGYIPNSIAQAQLDTDFNSFATQGSYYVNEVYAELDVPLVSRMPFAEEIEVQGAFRGFDYSTFGTGGTFKLGARWRPIQDFTLRGTYSTGFRAPGIPELYAGRAPNFPAATDPCDTTNPAYASQCGTALNNQGGLIQIPETIGGNANLQPERARIWTVGAVFEPTMVRGFTLTTDYYYIKIKNALGLQSPTTIGASIGVGAILHACYPGAGGTPDPNACALITRDPSGVITNVEDINVNQGDISTSGIDLAAQYNLPTDFGRFLFRLNGNYLIYLTATPFPNTTIEGKGNYDLGVNPALKFNAGINYTLGGLDLGVFGRFVGPFTECADSNAGGSSGAACSYHVTAASGQPFPTHQVPAEMTFDVSGAYKLRNPAGTTTFSAGIRNIFNTNPVRVYNSFLTYADTSAYDFVGRFFYGRITHAF